MRLQASSRERPYQTQYTLAVISEFTILAYHWLIDLVITLSPV
jgi:hypothetical protein